MSKPVPKIPKTDHDDGRILGILGTGDGNRNEGEPSRKQQGASGDEEVTVPYKDPQKRRDYQREYRRTRRAGDASTTPCTTPIPTAFRLATAADVLELIEEQVGEVRRDVLASKVERARCIGYLASIALKAIEAGNVAARVEELERVLKRRNERRVA